MPLASLLQEAQAAHDRREWDAAARGYDAFIAAGGAPVPTLLALGDVLKEAGRLDVALASYARMMRLAPDDLQPAQRLGCLAAAMDRPATASPALRTAYRIGMSDEPVAPLRDLVTPSTRILLTELGLLTPNADLFSSGDPYATEGASPVDLHVVARDTAGPVAPARVVAVVQTHASAPTLGRAGVRAAAAFAGAAPAGAVLTVALLSGEGEAVWSHAQALGAELRALRLPHLVLVASSGCARALINVGLNGARTMGAHALVARGDALAVPPTTAAFDCDPMAGFAVGGADDPSAGADWRRGPPSSGDWVLIRNRVIAEFGGLDALFDGVDAGLMDLMSRANRCGFTCLRQRSGPPSRTDRSTEEDAAILAQRYPEQTRARARARTEPKRLASDLALPGVFERNSLLLDLTSLRAHHDGTAELAVQLTAAMAASGREVHVWCAEESARFHGLHLRRGLTLHAFDRADPKPPPGHSVCFKLGQPLTRADLLRTWTAAPVCGFYMLDSIAMDVAMLDEADYALIWGAALAHSEMIGWLSDYSRAQFAGRLTRRVRPGDFIALCSTDPSEYASQDARREERGRGVLVIGNPFPHKNVGPTVERLRTAWPDLPLTVLGLELAPREGVEWRRSGALAREDVGELYAACGVVVYPSFYEGFGLPVMHALARGRPVLALDQPSLRELAARCPLARNLHLFSTTDDLVANVERVRTAPFQPADPFVEEHRWEDVARELDAAAGRACRAFDRAELEARLTTAFLLGRAGGT